MKQTKAPSGFQTVDLETLDAVSGGGWRDWAPTWMGGNSGENSANQDQQQQQYDPPQEDHFPGEQPFYSEPSPIPGGGQIDFYPDPTEDLQ